LLSLATLAFVTWFERSAVLRGAAELWIVSDSPAPADAVVILGGGVEDRPFAAAQYFRAGLAAKILLSNPHAGPAVRLGLVASDAAVSRAILLKLGVPADAIETFGQDLRDTHDEATALRDWADHAGAHRLIVPTEIFSTRRVRWMLERALGAGFIVYVPALEPEDYQRGNWWQVTPGLIAFQNEVVKYAYYRMKY